MYVRCAECDEYITDKVRSLAASVLPRVHDHHKIVSSCLCIVQSMIVLLFMRIEELSWRFFKEPLTYYVMKNRAEMRRYAALQTHGVQY